VLHVDEVPLGVGLALERLRQLLALRVLAPHREVDDGLAVLEEPSADYATSYSLPRPHGSVGTAPSPSAPDQVEEGLPRHEHSSPDVERRDLTPGDQDVRARPRDTEQPCRLIDRECQSFLHGPVAPFVIPSLIGDLLVTQKQSRYRPDRSI
jgi:hypothetical protein